MKKQKTLEVYGPPTKKQKPTNHGEKVEIPVDVAFERNYAPDPVPDTGRGEQVQIPPISREYDEVSATLPADSVSLLPAEAQAEVDRERAQLEQEDEEMYQDFVKRQREAKQ